MASKNNNKKSNKKAKSPGLLSKMRGSERLQQRCNEAENVFQTTKWKNKKMPLTCIVNFPIHGNATLTKKSQGRRRVLLPSGLPL